MSDPKPTLDKITKALSKTRRVTLAIHERPDGDALSAALVLKEVLESRGVAVALFCPDPVPAAFFFLAGVLEFSVHSRFAESDSIIFLDIGEPKRSGLAVEIAANYKNPKPRLLINIDHHPQEHLFGHLNWIEPEASSTSEMVYLLLQYWDVKISATMATAVLTGLISDTGRFQQANTTVNSLRIAAVMLEKGARLNLIIQNTFHNKSLALLRLWGRALSRVRTSKRNQMAVTVVTKRDLKELGLNPNDDVVLPGLVSIINNIPDSRFALLLAEVDQHRIKGSLRSESYKGVDVSKIAKLFGGGGHPLASGFSVEGSLRQTKDGWEVV